MNIGKSWVRCLVLALAAGVLGAGGADAAEHQISMKDWLFHPKELTIEVGDRVTWSNEDDTMRNIYFEKKLPGAPMKDEPEKIRIRKSFSFKFDKAGEYNFYCKNHLDYDMTGKITVKGK